MTPHTPNSGVSSARMQLTLMVIAVVILGCYPLLRYGGRWGELDTNAATWAIRTMAETGELIPSQGVIYPLGYAFQSLAVFLMHLSGVSLPALQIIGASLLIVLLVIPAWMLYRELIGTDRGATLATALLFLQPEFLFVTSRGTHEKFSRMLMILCLYLLVASMKTRSTAARMVGLVIAFYGCGYAIIAHNNLLATSFIFGMLLALLGAFFAVRYDPHLRDFGQLAVRRLISIVTVLLIMAFVFTFYLYPPARHQLDVLETIGDRLAAMLLHGQITGEGATVINPYAKWILDAWVSVPVYVIVSLADWLLIASSIAIWSWRGLRWLRRRWRPAHQGELLLWALYGAFTFQVALSVLIDISGAIASNLQHRIFPSFALLAVPMVAWAIQRWEIGDRRMQRIVMSGLAIGALVLAVLSIWKATNEPLVSNKWQFYVPGEMRGIDWAAETLSGGVLWSEYDERLKVAHDIRAGAVRRDVLLSIGDVKPGTRDFLLSDVTRARAARLGRLLPVEADSLITYDNGQAQVYHLRPRTPYQR